ncbi:hypothetical protein KNE206_62610 [Kitasatospora sp. NE20-6]
MPVTVPMSTTARTSAAKSARTSAQPVAQPVAQFVAQFAVRPVAQFVLWQIARIAARITAWAVASVAAPVAAWAAAARRGPVRVRRLTGPTTWSDESPPDGTRTAQPGRPDGGAGARPRTASRGSPGPDPPTENARKALTGDGKKVPAAWSRLGDDREQMGTFPINSFTSLSGG